MLFRVLHPNRWFIWAISLIFITFILAWGASERTSIEQERIGSEAQYEYAMPPKHQAAATTSPDTSTWKTYRNEEFGFEFMYPNNWNPDKSFNKLGGLIYVFDDNVGISVKLDGERNEKSVLANSELINFHGLEVTKQIQKDQYNNFVTISIPQKGLEIGYDYSYQKDLLLVDKILDTFKFFEPNN
jgi:hypothetical protein